MRPVTAWSAPDPGASVLVLSPHLDDAAWSIGALVAELTDRNCQVTLATAFTETAGVPSTVGRELVDRAGLRNEDESRARRAENDQAARILGVATRDERLLDAIYRLPDVYSTRDRLAGPHARVDDADPATAQYRTALARLVVELRPSVVLAPLGIGGHVDHQIVAMVASEVLPEQTPAWYYEDFPYCVLVPYVPSPLTRQSVPRWRAEPRIVPVSEAAVDRHVRAAGAYESQVRSFFGDPDTLAARLGAWLRKTGGNAPALRLWRLSAARDER